MRVNLTLSEMSDTEILEAISVYGGANKAARALGIPKSTFKDRAQTLLRKTFVTQKSPSPVFAYRHIGATRSFIFSSAQDGSAVNLPFLRNLEAYADHLGATLVIAGYTYNKSLFEDHSTAVAAFHPYIRPYMLNCPIIIEGQLRWCGEMNIMPTQSDPLSGFETYTRDKWGIFPHPRVTLKSIPVMWNASPKMIMTTGTVTQPNYVQKKAGIKAEFHHVNGAVIVEVPASGRGVFCRHLIAAKDGSFQDLTIQVVDRKVTNGHRVEAITWGDTHPELLDSAVAKGAWGLTAGDLSRATNPNNMLDILRPRYQFFHDALDFRRRNHHSIGDPHYRYEMMVKGTDSVEDEVETAAFFLERAQREDCHTVVVDSNHDRALLKWLKHADYRQDPANAIYFLKLQKAVYEAIRERDETFQLVEHAFRETGCDIGDVEFLRNTDTFQICDGIECALHGDLGANGAKGHVNTFSKMGPKANVAHSHAAAIFEGIYVAGHSCQRDMGYNRGGLSSWSPSHIVTYPNGKRAIITMQGTKFRA